MSDSIPATRSRHSLESLQKRNIRDVYRLRTKVASILPLPDLLNESRLNHGTDTTHLLSVPHVPVVHT